MRKNTITGLALLVLLGYLGLAWSARAGGVPGGQALDPVWARVQARAELRVAIDLGYRPFGFLQGEQVTGYDVELARAVAERLGARARFVPTGGDALYEALARGDADMIASALPLIPAHSGQARFSQVYFNAGQVLLVQRTRGFSSDQPLEGLRIGAVLGSDGDTLLRRAERSGISLVRQSDYDHTEGLLTDLRAGTLDAVVVDNAAGLAASNDDPSLLLLRALEYTPYVLAVPPAAYQLQRQVDAALQSLEPRGCLTALNTRWFTTHLPTDSLLPAACS